MSGFRVTGFLSSLQVEESLLKFMLLILRVPALLAVDGRSPGLVFLVIRGRRTDGGWVGVRFLSISWELARLCLRHRLRDRALMPSGVHFEKEVR